VTPARGPTSIRTENGQLATYIYVDIRDRDLGGYVADAQRAVAASIQFPAGYYVMWSGQYEYLDRATARLKIVVPLTLMIIFLLLYLNFRSVTETMIVMLSLPFALVGGLWLMWWLGFNLSVAVAVGFIALAGVAAETGVVMLIYLNQALAEIKARRDVEGRALTRDDLYDAIMEGAVERVRPKMMTVVAIMAGLLPIMWSTGTGSEIMQRIAVPMIGGMISSTLLTLFVIAGKVCRCCLRKSRARGPSVFLSQPNEVIHDARHDVGNDGGNGSPVAACDRRPGPRSRGTRQISSLLT
jgi:Cu(I)/Ag(I) efflux system membrane protein CusA/SilA